MSGSSCLPLSEELGEEADVVLIDRSDGFVFGFSKLDVMFGRAEPAAVRHAYAGLGGPGRRPRPERHTRPGGGRERVLHGGGRVALRHVLAAFDGGRVVVGVTSTPFKCPPAPSETALMMHDFLTARSPWRPGSPASTPSAT